MATTTNYGWTTPNDTDLVKDGAAAIRTLGSAIDTTVFNNVSAGVQKTIVDAKGDIIAATAADTVSRLAVGANNTVLTADSSTATGLKWAAPGSAAGSYTLLNTGGTALSGSSTVTVSGISGQDKLIVMVRRATTTNNLTNMGFRFNGVSALEYDGIEQILNIGTTYSKDNFITSDNFANNYILVGNTSTSTASQANSVISMDGCNSTGIKSFDAFGGAVPNTGNAQALTSVKGIFRASAAITSVSITALGTTFTGGTIFVYGSAV